MAVKVLRRPYLGGQGQIVGGKLYVDCPIILTADHGLIQQVDSDDQHSSTQYQLAVNRKYHIRDNSSVRTDYPWVQSFGRQAQQDAVRLQEGANVYVNGGLQTREVVRSCTCENCGFQYTWQDSASEIIPYSTEYLTGCLFPERNEAG